MNRASAGDFNVHTVQLCGQGLALFFHGQTSPPAEGGVVHLPGNFRDMVRETFSAELDAMPSGMVRVLELDRLEAQCVKAIIQTARGDQA